MPQRRVRRVRRRASGPRGRHGCAPLTAVLCGVARAQLQLQMFKEHMELESQPGPDVTFGVPDGAEAYAGPLQGDEMRSSAGVRATGPRHACAASAHVRTRWRRRCGCLTTRAILRVATAGGRKSESM